MVAWLETPLTQRQSLIAWHCLLQFLEGVHHICLRWGKEIERQQANWAGVSSSVTQWRVFMTMFYTRDLTARDKDS